MLLENANGDTVPVMLSFLMHLLTVVLSPDTDRLATALQKQASYYLDMDSARSHVIAAKMASTDEISAELLLGLAYVESRYLPLATSRVEGEARKTGIPSWKSPPSDMHGPYFCGVTQADARFSWGRCLELRDIQEAYRTTARELTIWRNHPLCRASDNRMQCALWGYGGGKPAIELKTSTYPNRVMFRATALHRATSSSS